VRATAKRRKHGAPEATATAMSSARNDLQDYPARRVMPRPRSEPKDLWTSLLIDAA
jgi:hypothetical protein